MATVELTIIPAEGCLASSVAAVTDLLYAANAVAHATGVDVQFACSMATPSGGPCVASNQMILSTKRLRDVPTPHVVMVTGPGARDRSSLLDYLHDLTRRPALSRWLHAQHHGGALLVAGCVGVFVLAELGLTRGRSVTTTWWLAEDFRARYPDTHLSSNAMVVVDGSLVTAGAAMAHLDLALHVIRRFAGPQVARLTARYTIVDQQRSSQAVYAIAEQTRAEDPLVRRAVALLTEVEGLRLTVSQLAGRVGTTPRTLHRRFASCLGVTPSEFMARERVRRAKDLLETTALAVDEIGLRVGFHDASAFRRAFKREADVTPSAYRRRFAP